jgi:hypothetical protein
MGRTIRFSPIVQPQVGFMTVNGHILTGSRTLGLIGDLTGHILTGSGANRGLGPLIGHVITGAGHFIEIAGYMVQEAPIAYQRASQAFDRVQMVANRLQGPMLIPTNAAGDFMLAPNWSQRNIIPADSSAYERFREDSINQIFQELKEMGLTLGSALSGDMESAIEHGLNLLEMHDAHYQSDLQYLRDILAERAAGRSGEGIVRDLGMIRSSQN